jgi:hypothetical protein
MVHEPWPMDHFAFTCLKLLLHAKRTAAAAASGRIRIVELKSGSVQAFDIVDLSAIHVEEALLVHENPQAVEFKDLIALVAEVLIESHPIRESRTAAAHNLDSKAGIWLRLLGHDLLDLVLCFFR